MKILRLVTDPDPGWSDTEPNDFPRPELDYREEKYSTGIVVAFYYLKVEKF
jgi:hypothetical protein